MADNREPWWYLVGVCLDNPIPKGREALAKALGNAFALSGLEIKLVHVRDEKEMSLIDAGNTELGIVAPIDDDTEEIHKLLERIIINTSSTSGRGGNQHVF